MSPPALEYTVRTCLAKDPESRYASAHDVLLQLKWLSAAGSQIAALPVPSRRRRMRVRTWATAAVLGLAGLLAGYFAHRTTPPPRIDASIELPAG